MTAVDLDAAKRLRRICKLMGLENSVPVGDANLMAVQFAVFGMIASTIERKLTTPSVPPIALAVDAEWKLVPVKPTADMAKAGMDQWDRTYTQHDLYVAMVNAAPSPSTSSVPVAFPNEGHCAARAAGESCNCPEVCLRWVAAPPANPAPSVPKKLSDSRIREVIATIRPGDGWDGDQWDFAVAEAIETEVRRAILQANGATK